MKTNARLEAITLKGGEKPKTVLTFVTTQPADEYNLGKTVSEKMGAGKLTTAGGAVTHGKLTRKVANPDDVARSADVTIKLTADILEGGWADDIGEDFDLRWEPAKPAQK
jgi:hypothetical protein